MNKFLKVQIASIIGSAADYGLAILLTHVFDANYLIANFLGNLTGGGCQFILCRNWALKSVSRQIPGQIARFAIVFVGNLILSAAGTFILVDWFHLNFIFSKAIVSVLLGVSYNYLLQKSWVFKERSNQKSL